MGRIRSATRLLERLSSPSGEQQLCCEQPSRVRCALRHLWLRLECRRLVDPSHHRHARRGDRRPILRAAAARAPSEENRIIALYEEKAFARALRRVQAERILCVQHLAQLMRVPACRG
eukprot:560601-Prymnesium_polylepis.1